MALQKSFDDRWGNSHSAAYYRVEEINMDISTSCSKVKVKVYKDQTARNDGKEPLEIIYYIFDSSSTPNYDGIFGVTMMENKNPIKGIYDEIKQYPEFSGATDV